MTTTTRNEAAERLTRKRITEWMQGWVDYSTMEMWGSGELEGSAFAGILQRNIAAFIGSARRDLGIALKGDDDHDYWTPEQHNAYIRAGERRATVERAAAIIAAHGFGHAMPMDHDDWRDGESAFDHIRRHLDEEVAR